MRKEGVMKNVNRTNGQHRQRRKNKLEESRKYKLGQKAGEKKPD